MSKEAMMLALNALYDIIPANSNRSEINVIQHKAIAALKEALAEQQEQQAVAGAAKDAIMGAAYDFRDAHISGSKNLKRTAHAELESAVIAALAGQPAPVQEPVGYVYQVGTPFGPKLKPVLTKAVPVGAKLYTAAPQPASKPLTDAEIHNLDPCPHAMFDGERIDFARAVEAAHGIKE